MAPILKQVMDRTLDMQPINMSMALVLTKLRELETAQVVLEPGDATRYTLLLTPLVHWNGNPLLMVTRLETSEFPHSSVIGTVVLSYDQIKRSYAYEPLARSNTHTGEVLKTFIETLTSYITDGWSDDEDGWSDDEDASHPNG